MKRKATATDDDKLSAPEPPRKKKSSEAINVQALPATPAATTPATMDSDEDFISSPVSDDDFMEDQDSDVSIEGSNLSSHADVRSTDVIQTTKTRTTWALSRRTRR